jgi:hypothetical protein
MGNSLLGLKSMVRIDSTGKLILPRVAGRGMHKGAEPLLWGEWRARHVPAVLAGRGTCCAWGEPARPGFPPEGETGRGNSSSLLPQAVCAVSVVAILAFIMLPVLCS